MLGTGIMNEWVTPRPFPLWLFHAGVERQTMKQIEFSVLAVPGPFLPLPQAHTNQAFTLSTPLKWFLSWSQMPSELSDQMAISPPSFFFTYQLCWTQLIAPLPCTLSSLGLQNPTSLAAPSQSPLLGCLHCFNSTGGNTQTRSLIPFLLTS